jgi:spermidine dehydrogenase
MGRAISRRDFLFGVGAVAAGAMAPGCEDRVRPSVPDTPVRGEGDPASRGGMRGSHEGSYEVAHDLAFHGRVDWGPVETSDSETYDLVVVGGGISGLSAAYFQLQKNPGSRILILENHDDFGGHARRNEFRAGDRVVLGYGGGQTFEAPRYYSQVAHKLLTEVGVDLSRLGAAYDQQFYRRHGLGGGVFFDRATYGVDRLVRHELVDLSGYMPLDPSGLSAAEAVAQMPISEPARKQLRDLLDARQDRLAPLSPAEQQGFLDTISYRDFLERFGGVREPEVFAMLEGVMTDVGASLETATAADSILYTGLPGLGATGISRQGFEEDPYIAHFPDGLASLARMLVRALIPRAASGATMEDIVGAHFDYSRLDESNAPVRLRLESTVVRVEHDGAPDSSDRVTIDYVRGGRAFRVRSRACVLAGYNAMVPYLCPELPERQRQALSLAVKMPIFYTNVLLRNWRPWKELGVAAVSAPGSYHANAMLDFPVSLGGYAFSDGPDEPVVVHMERFWKALDPLVPSRDQFRAGRAQMLATSFTEIEREIRTQLAGTLGSGGFDPERDIEAITVNRWGHGYAYSPSLLIDGPAADEERPHVIGRARFGRIAIANSDAGGRATVDTAIDQANRAIGELAGV